MNARRLFRVLPVCLFAGCKDTDQDGYGIGYGVLVLGTTAYEKASEAVHYATKKHIYAPPGAPFPDFEKTIAHAEHLRFISWGMNLNPSPNFAADHAYVCKYVGKRAIYYGRFVQGPNVRFEDRVKLSSNDIASADSFAAKLKTHADLLSSYLINRFSEEGRAALVAYPESGKERQTLETILLREINAIILGPSIYAEDRFRGVTLRPGTSRLLSLDPDLHPGFPFSREQMIAVVNRMLLQDTYPSNFPQQPERTMEDFIAVKF
jgi:hypothetical protein